MKKTAPAIQQVEEVKHSQAYVHGLLSNFVHKNVEQMTLGFGKMVCSLQRFIVQSGGLGKL